MKHLVCRTVLASFTQRSFSKPRWVREQHNLLFLLERERGTEQQKNSAKGNPTINVVSDEGLFCACIREGREKRTKCPRAGHEHVYGNQLWVVDRRPEKQCKRRTGWGVSSRSHTAQKHCHPPKPATTRDDDALNNKRMRGGHVYLYAFPLRRRHGHHQHTQDEGQPNRDDNINKTK